MARVISEYFYATVPALKSNLFAKPATICLLVTNIVLKLDCTTRPTLSLTQISINKSACWF